MMRDGCVRASIWAAVTICRYVNDVNPHFSQPAREQLERFKARIREMDEKEGGNNWQEIRDFLIEKTEERVPGLKDYI